MNKSIHEADEFLRTIQYSIDNIQLLQVGVNTAYNFLTAKSTKITFKNLIYVYLRKRFLSS